MSTVLIHHCDGCGERIMIHRTMLRVETGALRTHRPEIDLCQVCAERFSATLLETIPAAAELPADVLPADDYPPLAGRSAEANDLYPAGVTRR